MRNDMLWRLNSVEEVEPFPDEIAAIKQTNNEIARGEIYSSEEAWKELGL